MLPLIHQTNVGYSDHVTSAFPSVAQQKSSYDWCEQHPPNPEEKALQPVDRLLVTAHHIMWLLSGDNCCHYLTRRTVCLMRHPFSVVWCWEWQLCSTWLTLSAHHRSWTDCQRERPWTCTDFALYCPTIKMQWAKTVVFQFYITLNISTIEHLSIQILATMFP